MLTNLSAAQAITMSAAEMHCIHMDYHLDATFAAKLRGNQAEAREIEVLARLAAATPCMGRHTSACARRGYRQSRAVRESGRRFR